jgi:hypothetical protein
MGIYVTNLNAILLHVIVFHVSYFPEPLVLKPLKPSSIEESVPNVYFSMTQVTFSQPVQNHHRPLLALIWPVKICL